MSVKVMGMVFDMDLRPDEKLVLLAYADHANHDGRGIWPAVITVAKKTGYSERQIQRITKKLKEKEFLIQDGYGPKSTKKWYIPMQGGDKMSPRQNVGGDMGGSEGVTNETDRGDIAMSPEPSLTVLKPSKDKDKILNLMLVFAPQIFDRNISGWKALQKHLEQPEVLFCHKDGRIEITGIGKKADLYQSRYALSFSRILSGSFNKETQIYFAE